jgi:hypothetical protein
MITKLEKLRDEAWARSEKYNKEFGGFDIIDDDLREKINLSRASDEWYGLGTAYNNVIKMLESK